MARSQIGRALIALLVSAPLGVAVASAAPPAEPAPVTAAAPAGPAGQAPPLAHLPGAAPNESLLPFPMSLPDEATTQEVQGMYALGIAGLIFGAVAGIVLIGGAFHYLTFRSWSHPQ